MPGGQEYSFNLGLDVLPLSQDQNNLPDFYRLYNAVKGLAVALDSAAGTISRPKDDWATAGISALRLQNMCRLYVLFSDTVISGNLINLYNNAGVLTARKAGGAALAGGLAMGYVLDAVAAGNYGEVFLKGANPYISGLTPGALYYTSTASAGTVSNGASSPYIQSVGFALNSSCLWFDPLLYAR